jgi:hypothetical protein
MAPVNAKVPEQQWFVSSVLLFSRRVSQRTSQQMMMMGIEAFDCIL